MGDSRVRNGRETKVFVEPPRIGCADVDRKFVEHLSGMRDDLFKKGAGKAVSPVSGDDVQPANTARSTEAGFWFRIQSCNGNNGVVAQMSEQDFSGCIESVGTGPKVCHEAVDHVMAFGLTFRQDLCPVVRINRLDLFRFHALSHNAAVLARL